MAPLPEGAGLKVAPGLVLRNTPGLHRPGLFERSVDSARNPLPETRPENRKTVSYRTTIHTNTSTRSR